MMYLGNQAVGIAAMESAPVTVEALSVTENGTYTAVSGHAYSPVTVTVAGDHVINGGAMVDTDTDQIVCECDATDCSNVIVSLFGWGQATSNRQVITHLLYYNGNGYFLYVNSAGVFAYDNRMTVDFDGDGITITIEDGISVFAPGTYDFTAW